MCTRWKLSSPDPGQTQATAQGFTGPSQLGHQGNLLGPQGLLQGSGQGVLVHPV